MALVIDIVRDAYREANLIPITQSPTLDESTEALRLLNRYIKSVYGNEAGEGLQAYPVGSNNVTTINAVSTYKFTGTNYVPLNARLMVNLNTATTVNLHPNPEDGSRLVVIDVSNNSATYPLTLNGNGRNIDGASSALINVNGTSKEWFYRADLGSWVSVSVLGLNDTFPFPLEFEDLFVIGLATRINPRNGVSIDSQAMLNYKRMLSIFKARYSQTVQPDSEDGLLRLSGTRLNRVYNSGTRQA